MRAVMDLETENRIAAMLLREAAELRRQAEKEDVRAYLEKPTVRARPNSRFLTATVLGVQQAVPVIVIVVSVVSCILVLIVGGAIGGYIWKHRHIEKKRRGSEDVQKMVKTLNDSSLNFKYSTLEKATGCFDEANKLGQGGFGSVYKGVLADGREIAVKRPEVRWPEFQLQIVNLGVEARLQNVSGFWFLGIGLYRYRRLLLDFGQSGAMVEAKLILVEVQRTFEELHLEYKPYPGAIATLNKLATNGAKMVIIHKQLLTSCVSYYGQDEGTGIKTHLSLAFAGVITSGELTYQHLQRLAISYVSIPLVVKAIGLEYESRSMRLDDL
ncbi:unnamed protein product [Linum tenue]|uniref:Uncharacterized protein n=1 Tax=Linum tenue TaxID=586396 RepID=A0AAV0IPE7_9ROSI|nr:unnamed protein product [Linum tenue]